MAGEDAEKQVQPTESMVDEFEIYCRTKPAEECRRLAAVRDLILANARPIGEGRAHFYHVFHLGHGVVAKIHPDAKGQANITFVTGSELHDPSGLLKGKSLSRTVKITSDAYLAKHADAIADLVRQAHAIISGRMEGPSEFRGLRPDQPSP